MTKERKTSKYGFWDRGVYIEVEYSIGGGASWLAYDQWPARRPNVGGGLATRTDEAEHQAVVFVDEFTKKPRPAVPLRWQTGRERKTE
jgi:hypothetical protein